MRAKLLGAGTKVALVRVIGMGAGFLLTVVLARTLGPDGLGIYAYALSILALAAVPVANGWSTILLRETSRGEPGPCWPQVRGMIVWGGRLAALSAIIALGIGQILALATGAEAYRPWVIVLLVVVLFFDQISALRLAVLRGLDHPVWGQVPEMLVRPALILSIFLALTATLPGPVTVTVAFVSLLGASVLTVAFGLAILRWKAPRDLLTAPTETHLGLWLRSAALLAGNSWLVILNSQIDFLMLGALGSAEQLGLYRVAIQIALLSGTAYVALNMIAMQRFAKLSSAGQMDELQATVTFLSRIAFAASLPLPVIFLFAGEDILGFVFGAEYRAANTALLLLLLVQTVSACAGFAHTVLVTANRERLIVPLTLGSVLLNFALCTVLIPRYQLEGAAIAMLVAVGSWNFMLWLRCLRATGVDSSILGLKGPRP